ncbi:unnamed protein product [Darwinula stevensoni]|uniref:TIR domain-containing protein n=1 Tax=Darwinula stevensoni TaxID=69355 RepID=A0A7R8XE35_9CRUS|nr:unnamed protein product [Darwinula stevensoni]CAG0893663.1 unnamed protein product [Darwinula stevensoni]
MGLREKTVHLRVDEMPDRRYGFNDRAEFSSEIKEEQRERLTLRSIDGYEEPFRSPTSLAPPATIPFSHPEVIGEESGELRSVESHRYPRGKQADSLVCIRSWRAKMLVCLLVALLFVVPFTKAEGETQECLCRCRTTDVKGNPGTYCTGAECCAVPVHLILPNTTFLEIVRANFPVLKPGSFENLTSLIYIDLHSNEIAEIEPGAFQGLSSVNNLTLSFNVLVKLDPNAFRGLTGLEWLFMVKNHFKTLSDVTVALSPAVLPNLFRLHIGGNDFGEIHNDSFLPMNGSHVRDLQFPLCQLRSVHPDAFRPLPAIGRIQLRENAIPVDNLMKVIENLPSTVFGFDISSMSLTGEVLPGIMASVSKTQIRKLWAQDNYYLNLQNHTFPHMPLLEELYLQKVKLLFIEDGTFDNVTNLRHLDLSGNRLTGVPQAVLVPTLEFLNISGNSGGEKVKASFDVGRNRFLNTSHLKQLDLSKNYILRIHRDAFAGLSSLETLGLENNEIELIDEGVFLPLGSLKFLGLSGNDLSSGNPNLFHGLDSLDTLVMENCNVNLVHNRSVYESLPRLRQASLAFNKVAQISPIVFRESHDLRSLDLSHNTISSWNERAFRFPLDSLLLKNNKITTVTPAMLEDFNSVRDLDLSDNPFQCDCGVADFVAHLEEKVQNKSQSLHTEKLHYSLSHENEGAFVFDSYLCHLPEWKRGEQLLELGLSPEDCIPASPWLVIGMPVVLCIVLLTLLGFLLFRNRYYLLYYLHLARSHRNRRRRFLAEENGYSNYEYDAFISYSNEDREFVQRLTSTLEKEPPAFKLCIYERDFQVGGVLNECIIQGIDTSRTTIMILSENFVSSQWCTWELHMAQHQLFREKREGTTDNKGTGFGHVFSICEVTEVWQFPSVTSRCDWPVSKTARLIQIRWHPKWKGRYVVMILQMHEN